MASPSHTLPRFSAVIVAAGAGLRAGQPVPKQFADWRGKPVLRHAVEALLSQGTARIVVAIPENAEVLAAECLAGLHGVETIVGGATRQLSVRTALEAMARRAPERILIHDAARPDLPIAVTDRLLRALADHPGAIPVLPVVDSLAIEHEGIMDGKADRDLLRRVQTPQAFRFDAILAAHRAWTGAPNAGDDAQVLRAHGGSVAMVAGHERLAKLTFAEDFMNASPPVRTGIGYDVHRLAAGEELWLGGVRIEHDRGLSGHSDADVALHALTDALLGAIAAGDIGTHFPPSDPQWKGARSGQFLEHATSLVRGAGYEIGNIDLTIICEEPRIGPHRPAMRARISELLCVDSGLVSVKATTTERLGFTGRGEGIAAQAVASVYRNRGANDG